jgi:type II secretory pathway pseudopilin PulG
MHKDSGFTIVEVLVVIGVFLGFVAFTWFLLDPYELKRRGDDAMRLADLATLQQAINSVSTEASTSGKPALCMSLSTPCKGESNSNDTDSRKSNGTGWIKVDLTSQKSVGVPILPLDPINDNKFFYTFVSDGSGWEITVPLESNFYKAKMATDGGNNENMYEVGTNLTLVD